MNELMEWLVSPAPPLLFWSLIVMNIAVIGFNLYRLRKGR